MGELIQRCSWATTDLYKEYHDNEWGKPVHDENKLFEMLILEGMQAGLSWLTILNKREAFRIAFDNFDCKKVALYDDAKIEKLMPYGRVPQGHPVIVDYFYHEEIRGTENTGKRNR